MKPNTGWIDPALMHSDRANRPEPGSLPRAGRQRQFRWQNGASTTLACFGRSRQCYRYRRVLRHQAANLIPSRPLSFELCRSDPALFLRPGIRSIRSNAFQPYLAPIRIDTAWAKEPTFAIARFANYRIEYDGGSLHFLHFARLVVDDPLDALQHSENLTAIGDFFGVPVEAPVPVSSVQRLQYLPVGLDLYQFPRLEIEGFHGSGLIISYRAGSKIGRAHV